MRTHGLRISVVLALFFSLAGAARARQVPITILHTTDLHGHVLPCVDSTSGKKVGGALRFSTAIEEIRKTESNVLYVDCGDLIQGSAESWLTQGRIMTRTLEWLHCDAWVVGNHDLDWGIDSLAALQDQTSLNMLAANLSIRPGTTNRLHALKPYVVKNVDGIRIVFVGLTTPGIPTWTRPEMLGDIDLERSVRSLAGILPSVRAEKPDIMVLLVHQGYLESGDDNANEINQLARSFPEFDVMLGGHRHQPLALTSLNGILYCQAGYYGRWLGRADLVFDTVRRKVIRKTARLIPIEDGYEENPELKKMLQVDLEKTESDLKEDVGVAETALVASVKMPAQSPVQQLICRAISEAANVDLVMHGILTEGCIQAGKIKCSDMWRIIPYDNRIGIADLTMPELRDILEENTDQIGSVHFLGVYGLSYELHPHAPPGQRVRNLQRADGSRPDEGKRFPVAMNSYVLASGGGRFSQLRKIVERPESRLHMTDRDTRSAVTEYVRKHSPLQIDAGTNVTVVRREPPKR